MAKRVRWTGVGSKVGEMPRADLLKSGHWRAVCGESRKHGSVGGGWKRTQPVTCHCPRMTGSRTPAQDVPRQPPTRPLFPLIRMPGKRIACISPCAPCCTFSFTVSVTQMTGGPGAEVVRLTPRCGVRRHPTRLLLHTFRRESSKPIVVLTQSNPYRLGCPFKPCR